MTTSSLKNYRSKTQVATFEDGTDAFRVIACGWSNWRFYDAIVIEKRSEDALGSERWDVVETVNYQDIYDRIGTLEQLLRAVAKGQVTLSEGTR